MDIFDLTPNSIKLLITNKDYSKDFLLELKVHDVQMYFVIGYFQTNIK